MNKIVFSFDLVKKLSLVLSVLIILGFVVFVLPGTGLFVLNKPGKTGDSNSAPLAAVENPVSTGKTAVVSPEISVFEIVDFNCSDCIKMDALKTLVERYGIDVNSVLKKIDFKAGKAGELIEKYNIKKIPTLIVSGDLSGTGSLKKDWNLIGSIEGDGSLVARKFLPPFLDLETGKVKGIVKLVMVTDSNNCASCTNPLANTMLFNTVNQAFIKNGLNIVEASSKEGRELIKKYRLAFVPSLVFSPEIQDYPFFSQLRSLGTIEADNFFVVREKFPPFLELETNRVRGLADAIIVQYSNCWACFNAKDLVLGLQNGMGLRFRGISVLDANTETGKNIVKNFSLKKLPAAIIGGDLSVYPNFEQTWKKIGRKDKNVFILDSNVLLGQGFYIDAQTLKPITLSRQAQKNT